MDFPKIHRERNLFPDVAGRHPLLERRHEILFIASQAAEIDRAAGRGWFNHVYDPGNRVVVGHLEWRHPRHVEVLRANSEEESLPTVWRNCTHQLRRKRQLKTIGRRHNPVTILDLNCDLEEIDARGT